MFTTLFSFKWHLLHLNVNLEYLCSSKKAIMISFIVIGLVVSPQTLTNALFNNNGRPSPIPWHLSVGRDPQSLHTNFFIYEDVNVSLIRFVNTFEP